MSCPRLVIAGTSSGVGKTSLTLGLTAALCRRGLKVQTFKVGPDFLDPTWLALASGRPCINLDGWMCGEDYVRDRFARASADADIAIVEGVMGLFDGADPADAVGSTAEIARWLDAPVLLVVNAHGMARSLAALVKGYAEFDPELQMGGVIANRCGSARHASWLSEALAAAGMPPLLGAVRRDSLPPLPSRHLGLVTADRQNLSASALANLADAVEQQLDLARILELNKGIPWETPVSVPDTAPLAGTQGVRIGLAFDEAFHFYYPDNLQALEETGATLVRFSPLRDRTLPDGLDSLIFGGGYPEEYAADLEANRDMRRSVAAFASAGNPVYAECGGLMYLSAGIELRDGVHHKMVGALPFATRMLTTRKRLGYTEVKLLQKGPFGDAGTCLRGHEFHYSEIIDSASTCTDGSAWQVRYRRSGTPVMEGYQHGNLFASYIHIHFASRPGAAEAFVDFARGDQ
ncbi:cobyrinic acid a,c-diamide synthase [Syntrophotalea acetylenivorans]|uniref:Cobyrinate a,c-diamide synthase n=1 Tax=Syntrophotalea acetylenivorans TaxID=1842532 RepID=A0A1L3GNH6_9BACT|nr:cobyrinate a,c-diamide synthase [Syntrophotalea acetylenivorans]APG27461.1 cobyrinic acid a,c-diamide synthase [Syntrophotalea acetylenivorans]